MLYEFYPSTQPYARSQVETWDGVITHTAPSLAWAIGKRIEWFIAHSKAEGYEWRLLHKSLRSSSLVSRKPIEVPIRVFS